MSHNKKKFFITLGCGVFFLFFLSGAFGVDVVTADVAPNNAGAPKNIKDILSGSDTGTGILGRNIFSNIKDDPREMAREIIFIVFGFLGTLMIALILYSGFLWMSAKEKGEKDKILVARAHLTNAIIGAVIVMSAWTISIFVLDTLKKTIEK